MDAGLPDYGCFIASEKRLTNFDISLNDAETVPPLRSKGTPRSLELRDKLTFSLQTFPGAEWSSTPNLSTSRRTMVATKKLVRGDWGCSATPMLIRRVPRNCRYPHRRALQEARTGVHLQDAPVRALLLRFLPWLTRAFVRRAIKARSHIIYNDTNHNSSHSVYLNIYQSFLIVALKFHSYIKEWGADPRRRPAFFLGQHSTDSRARTELTRFSQASLSR